MAKNTYQITEQNAKNVELKFNIPIGSRAS